jgi:hypothetical protein
MMTESLISSIILVILVINSGTLYGKSTNALYQSRKNDNVVTTIFADLDYLQQCVSLYGLENVVDASVPQWDCRNIELSQIMPYGQLNYKPDEQICFDNKLASDVLNTHILPLNNSSNINNDLPDNLKITRYVDVEPTNGNLLRVTYTTIRDNYEDMIQSYVIPIPAHGWCP